MEQYPQLRVYDNLKDHEVAARGMFLAEGHHLVQRLVAASRVEDGGRGRPYLLDSVLTIPAKADELAALAATVDESVPVFVAPAQMINAIVGFNFHTGVLGAARRLPPLSLGEMLAKVDLSAPRVALLAMQELNNAANLGAIIRTAAALGVSGVLIGERCIDPWIRMAVRTSMGTMFSMPMSQSVDLVDDLRRLSTAESEGGLGFTTIATTLGPAAVNAKQYVWPARSVLVLGSEGKGLDALSLGACTQEVTIPMHHGTDSLNVAAATAILLWEMTRAI